MQSNKKYKLEEDSVMEGQITEILLMYTRTYNNVSTSVDIDENIAVMKNVTVTATVLCSVVFLMYN